MKLFFTNLYDKLKMILSVAGALLVAFIGYKLSSQKKEIEKLETDNALKNAENVTKEKQGELNEIKKESVKAETKLTKSRDNYAVSKSKLDKLRRNRPKD